MNNKTLTYDRFQCYNASFIAKIAKIAKILQAYINKIVGSKGADIEKKKPERHPGFILYTNTIYNNTVTYIDVGKLMMIRNIYIEIT